MAIDSVRMLTDSAGQLWQQLSAYGSIETLPESDGFDDWMRDADETIAANMIVERQLRRDYRRLCTLIAEIATLVHSRSRAVELIRARALEN